MTEENICPKHEVALKLRRNVKTGELALACPFCDVEERQSKDGVVREATEQK
jgi:hypothetical protein